MSDQRIRFGDFELDGVSYQLRRKGQPVPLERMPMDLLLLITQQRGELVTRDQIVAKLWGKNVFVDVDNSINTAIRKIRHALRDDARQPRLLVTVSGKGYRFIAPLASVPAVRKAVPGRQVLAVLPFENLSGDPDQEYLADGFTEEIISNLGAAGQERLGVIARTSVMRYKRGARSIAQIGRELNADYVMESSMRRDGNRLRITCQLIRVADETHMWARSYERTAGNMLDLQAELGAGIGECIRVELDTGLRDLIARRLPVNARAHDAYLRGRYYWFRRLHRDPQFSALHGIGDEDFLRCRAFFEEAVEADPAYVLGYCGLCGYWGGSAVHGMFPPREGWGKASAAAERALELDPQSCEAHHSMGAVHYFYHWDWAEAEGEFQVALRLGPNHPEPRRLYSRLLQNMGRGEEAVALAGVVQALDPLCFGTARGRVLLWGGRFEEAISELERAQRTGDDSVHVQEMLALAYEAKGMYAESIMPLKSALIASGFATYAEAAGRAFTSEGYNGVLNFYLKNLEQRAQTRYVSPFVVAETYGRLKQIQPTLEWLEKSSAERSSRFCELRLNPAFCWLRHDSGFQSMIERELTKAA